MTANTHFLKFYTTASRFPVIDSFPFVISHQNEIRSLEFTASDRESEYCHGNMGPSNMVYYWDQYCRDNHRPK